MFIWTLSSEKNLNEVLRTQKETRGQSSIHTICPFSALLPALCLGFSALFVALVFSFTRAPILLPSGLLNPLHFLSPFVDLTLPFV